MSKRPIILWLILLGALFAAFAIIGPSANQEKEVAVSEFISQVERGEISDVVINGDTVKGKTAKGAVVKTYATDKEELIRAMRAKNVRYEEQAPSNATTWIMLLLKLAIPLIIVVVIARGIKNAGPGNVHRMQTVNKSSMQKDVKTTFADVAGCDEAVEEVRDLVRFLKNPGKGSKLGGRIPKGVLLMGPSGTGKTLIARALAGEAGVPFFAASAAAFVEMFVGVGAARVRDLFENAKKHAPCIIFIDELDAVGKKRAGLSGIGGHTEMEQTLNELLVQMDGFTPNQGIIVVAATNRPETLDQALLRAGRFDRKVVVALPDIKGREAILKVHVRGKKMSPDVDLSVIARGTPGMSGADLEELLNEAALLADNANKEAIDHVDIEQAKEKMYMGPERKGAVLSEQEKNVIAWHEAGHTVVGWFTPEADPPHRVTIIPRGMALGLTWSLPTEDRKLRTRKQLLAEIKVLLGGRGAEERLLGKDNITTGASNDLERATATAKRMVCDFGMDEATGLRTFGEKERGFMFESSRPNYSEATARKLDDAEHAIVEKCHKEVQAMLEDKKDLLKALADALREFETVDAAMLLSILGARPVAT
jgi:cell division protease FtsH